MTFAKLCCLIPPLCAALALGQSAKEVAGLPVIRVDVDLVLVTATVTDADNKYVSGLTREDFRVWEDRIEQQVEYFSAENAFLSAGIVFDVSGSMKTKLDYAREAANAFLSTADKGDEYLLIQFNDAARLVQDFTSDIAKLQERLLFTPTRGNTSLYDAVYLGLEKVSRGSNNRKAVLLISDGGDNHSRYSFKDVKSFAQEHDVMIYSIGIKDDSVQATVRSRDILRNLTELTGGIAFFPRSLDVLPQICERIGLDLKNQYVLGYRSRNPLRDGKWRKLRVEVRRPEGVSAVVVRSKAGYSAPSAGK